LLTLRRQKQIYQRPNSEQQAKSGNNKLLKSQNFTSSFNWG
jgi:hypothetical protein